MSRAVLVIRDNRDREKAAAWCRNAPAGAQVELKAARRSTDQNRLLWQRLTEVAHQVEWYGQKLSAEDWKDVFSASLRRARVVPGIDAGSFVPLGMRTSDMTKQEMTDLLELIGAFGAERGVRFRDLDGEQAA
jgi:hypothetical protein